MDVCFDYGHRLLERIPIPFIRLPKNTEEQIFKEITVPIESDSNEQRNESGNNPTQPNIMEEQIFKEITVPIESDDNEQRNEY